MNDCELTIPDLYSTLISRMCFFRMEQMCVLTAFVWLMPKHIGGDILVYLTMLHIGKVKNIISIKTVAMDVYMRNVLVGRVQPLHINIIFHVVKKLYWDVPHVDPAVNVLMKPKSMILTVTSSNVEIVTAKVRDSVRRPMGVVVAVSQPGQVLY